MVRFERKVVHFSRPVEQCLPSVRSVRGDQRHRKGGSRVLVAASVIARHHRATPSRAFRFAVSMHRTTIAGHAGAGGQHDRDRQESAHHVLLRVHRRHLQHDRSVRPHGCAQGRGTVLVSPALRARAASAARNWLGAFVTRIRPTAGAGMGSQRGQPLSGDSWMSCGGCQVRREGERAEQRHLGALSEQVHCKCCAMTGGER